MRTTPFLSASGLALFVLAGLLGAGCASDSPSQPDEPRPGPAKAVEAKKVPLGRNVWLEVQEGRRRVLIDAAVCLRQGQLELLLCKKFTKEHEAILTADVDARDIHKALLAAGAEPGAPVQYQPQFRPASGPRIQITLQYEQQGKLVTQPAQRWVRDLKTKKDLAHDWVFAGSQLIPNPEDKNKPPLYLANGGDVICLANFEDALLDLPITSSKDNEELVFEAHTERIPPLDAKVVVILEPVTEPKKN